MVYEDVEFCYKGVNYRNEDLALQVGSKAEIVLSATNNNDVVTQQTLNFNVPTNHKSGVASKWSVTASSDPLGVSLQDRKKSKKMV